MKDLIAKSLIESLIEFILLDDGLKEWAFNNVIGNLNYPDLFAEIISKNMDKEIPKIIEYLKKYPTD